MLWYDTYRGFTAILLALFFVSCSNAAAKYSWAPEEMTPASMPERDGVGRVRMKLNNEPGQIPTESCGEEECFDLYYFKGKDFDIKDNKRPNILYIPGGPGQFGDGALGFLERNNNVLYLDPRGTGDSRIPRPNSFDHYLRARFVVEDIEQLRKKVLENRQWDAIYAVSYGTVIAQQYAREYPTQVKRLILVPPVSRHKDTEQAIRDQVLFNLEKIYKLIRTEDSVPCDCRNEQLNQTLKVPYILEGATTNVRVDPRDNFCFLNPVSIEKIRNKVKRVYDTIENEYGSIGFVVDNYDDLKDDPDFTYAFPYPKEFFVALRNLRNWGAPQEKDSNLFGEEIYDHFVSPAIVVGYYATLEDDGLRSPQQSGSNGCRLDSPFLEGAKEPVCKTTYNTYCTRIEDAKTFSLESKENRSSRALYVFGINDGFHRWIFRILKNRLNTNGCVTGTDIAEFAESTEQKHRFLRQITRKVGVMPESIICPWGPATYKHGVETLIVKGSADAVTAGCQAEDFFNDGLEEKKRVFIEIPAMGHSLNIRLTHVLSNPPSPTIWGIAYRFLVEKFINLNSAREFQTNGEVVAVLQVLKAKDRTPESGPIACGLVGQPSS